MEGGYQFFLEVFVVEEAESVLADLRCSRVVCQRTLTVHHRLRNKLLEFSQICSTCEQSLLTTF